MWRKPSIEKPDFKKANLEAMVSFAEMTENESLETNGGASVDITGITPVLSPIVISKSIRPIILSGFVARIYTFE